MNKDAACALGLDIEVGEITAVVLDFGGGIIAKKIIKIEIGRTANELVSSIVKVVNALIEENKLDTDKILGLGIAFAGIVDSAKGVVAMSSVIPEMNFPFLEKLSSFPFPVILENNANAAAIGFKWKSNDKLGDNILTVVVEIDQHVSGLGIGIILDGKLYRGASYSAGELFPHLPTLTEILYSYRSRFNESEILKDCITSYEAIDIEFLLNAAKQGDRIAKLVFTRIGNIVGQTIAPVVGLLNPDILIITGIVSELEDIVLSSIRNVFEMQVISITNNRINIMVDKYHHYSVAVGAASVILEEFFRVPAM